MKVLYNNLLIKCIVCILLLSFSCIGYCSIDTTELQNNISSQNFILKLGAVNALSMVEDKSTIPVFIKALEIQQQKPVYNILVEYLGKSGDENAYDFLVAKLNNGVDDKSIINALSNLQYLKAIPLLIKETTNLKIREYACKALSKFGDRAVEPLLDAMQTVDADKISYLYPAIGSSCDPKVIDILIKKLNDESPITRYNVIKGLENFDNERVINTLIETVNDDDDYRVRIQAIRALEKIKSPDALPVLKKALVDTDLRVSSKALSSIIQIKSPETYQINVDSFPELRYYIKIDAIMALGKLGNKNAVPVILKIMNTDDLFKIVSITALGNLRSNDAVEPVVVLMSDAFVGTMADKIRSESIKTLGEIGNPSCIDALLIEYNEHLTISTRKEIMIALGKIANIKSAEKILPFLQEKNEDLRLSVIAALGSCKNNIAVDPLIVIMNDKVNTIPVRVQAIKALSQIGDIKSAPSLIIELTDSAPAIRIASADALGLLQDSKSIDSLINTLSEIGEKEPLGSENSPYKVDTLSNVRRASTKALGNLKAEKAIPDLMKLACEDQYNAIEAINALQKMGKPTTEMFLSALKDANIEKQIIAARGIGGMGDTRATELLLKTLQEKDFNLRAASAMSLGQLKAVNAIDKLSGALKDDDSSVRANAAYALWMIGTEKSKEAVIKALNDVDAAVCVDTARGLGYTNDINAMKPLLKIVTSDNPFIRCKIAQVLQEISGEDYGANTIKWNRWLEEKVKENKKDKL